MLTDRLRYVPASKKWAQRNRSQAKKSGDQQWVNVSEGQG
jgi:hypothetical protein